MDAGVPGTSNVPGIRPAVEAVIDRSITWSFAWVAPTAHDTA
ncbi:hypothetical protein [Streptomyces sp. 8N706]